VQRAAGVLSSMSEAQAARPALAGGWSAKQVLGHLIDSAGNNHQRFVRAALAESYEGPTYAQAEWVRVQGYEQAPWTLLVETWSSMNRMLAHVLAQLPAEKAGVPCRVGDNAPMTLAELADSYVTHLRHHLAQLGVTTEG